jgi:hypothetical protein
VLEVTAAVDRITIGDRVLGVPFHGYVAVAVRTRRHAVVAALDRGGAVVERLDLARSPAELFAEQSRRRRGGPSA